MLSVESSISHIPKFVFLQCSRKVYQAELSMELLFPKHRERWAYPVKEERLGKIVFLGFRNLTDIFTKNPVEYIYIHGWSPDSSS